MVSRFRRNTCKCNTFSLERFEQRLCFSATVFVESEVACCSVPSTTIASADFDQDGDIDVLSFRAAEPTGLVWYENTDGVGGFEEPTVIMAIDGNLWDFFGSAGTATDVDGDGDMDVVFGLPDDQRIVWFENDGRGRFGDAVNIASVDESTVSLAVGDLDGDNDVDVVTTGRTRGRVTWYENANGTGHFLLRESLDTETLGENRNSVATADIDGDGDLDIVHLGHGCCGSHVAWYENVDGRGEFSEQRVIVFMDGVNLTAANARDMDGDGDTDILVARGHDGIAWYENTVEVFFDEHQLLPKTHHFAWSAYAADLDRDGDLDVLSGGSAGIIWHENQGRAEFGTAVHISKSTSENSDLLRWVNVADIDRDGDLDVLSAQIGDELPDLNLGNTKWFENRLTGDSNDDGVFNSGDLLKVFAIGKYEDSTPNNTAFDEGDWDQDGDFTTADLVFAFQAGNYVSGDAPAASGIAAAVDWLLAQDNDTKKSRAFVA